MTLASLKSYLDGAKSGTDISLVLFDFLEYADTNLAKTYPLAVWDIGNLKGTKNLRQTSGLSAVIEIDLYAMNLVTPEDDITPGSLVKWDALEADLLAYLTAVNALAYIKVLNLDSIEFEYYPAGILSMEREVGVLYRAVKLELWC